MRILYIHPYLTNFRNANGEIARQVVREMRKADVDVVTFPASDYADLDSGDNSITRSLYDHARRLATRWMPNFVAMFLLEKFLLMRAILRSIAWNYRIFRQRNRLCPDVLLARALEYDWTPWIAARILRCPLVLETHSPNYIERELRGQGGSRFVRWTDHVLWERAEKLWVVSRNLGQIVASSGVEPTRIRHISLGVSTAQYDPNRPEVTAPSANIAFVGSFHPWHGVATLLDAFALALGRGVEAKLILIGDGVTIADNQRQAEALGISQHVEFTGWLPLDEVAERLKTIDIAVAPYSKLEYFHFDPVKILEYMAMGLPVIASDQGEVPTILDEGRCGVLVPPGEIEPLANEIVRLAKDPDLCHVLGRAARQRVEEYYDWSITIQQVIALCRETVEERQHDRIMGSPGFGT
jgi:glycosyltransferase involved in cell wall biosynthesis